MSSREKLRTHLTQIWCYFLIPLTNMILFSENVRKFRGTNKFQSRHLKLVLINFTSAISEKDDAINHKSTCQKSKMF